MDPCTFYYVYILETLAAPWHFYTGFTEHLHDRLDHHNSGSVPHTAKSRPWHIKTALAFTERNRALDFERSQKTASGRAFAKQQL